MSIFNRATKKSLSSLPSGQSVFTMGEVSFLMQVSRRLCADYFDKNMFRDSFRMGNSRRVPRDSLIEFMLERHIPLDVSMRGHNVVGDCTVPRDMLADPHSREQKSRRHRKFRPSELKRCEDADL